MRPNALSIAGFDPSAGAGVLADIKTFESHRVYGMGVITANTMQNHTEFDEVKWVGTTKIRKQLDSLFREYEIDYVKIGLVLNLNIMDDIVNYVMEKNPNITIVWDPILKSSSGFEFHKEIDKEKLFEVCRKLDLTTPNFEEIKQLVPHLEPEEGAEYLSQCCPVLLKGGHREDAPIDLLYDHGKRTDIYNGELKDTADKHGTGCVLSSAIVANLALGESLKESCRLAKKYITGFIASNDGPLGYHVKDYHLAIAN